MPNGFINCITVPPLYIIGSHFKVFSIDFVGRTKIINNSYPEIYDILRVI